MTKMTVNGENYEAPHYAQDMLAQARESHMTATTNDEGNMQGTWAALMALPSDSEIVTAEKAQQIQKKLAKTGNRASNSLAQYK